MSVSARTYLKLVSVLVIAPACAAQTDAEPDVAGSDVPSRAGTRSSSAGASSGGQVGGAEAASGAPALAGVGAGGSPGTAGQPSSAGSPPNGGAHSSGGNATAGAAAGNATAGDANGGAAATAACPLPHVAPGTTPMIDDFNHLGRSIPTNEARFGVWDVWTLSSSADMSPKSANYTTTGADTGDGYTHWSGKSIGGTNDWGPTLTVQLAGGCPYDASVYSGISFKLQGTANKQGGGTSTPLPLKVMIWQPQGVPAKDAKGGTCSAVACYNHFSTYVNVPASWTTPVSVPFASLMQGVWTGTLPFVWDAKQLIAIQFQVEVDGSKSELATFDLSLDDLVFVK